MYTISIRCIDKEDIRDVFKNISFSLDVGIYECSYKTNNDFMLLKTDSILNKIIPYILQNGGILVEVYAHRKYDNFMLIVNMIIRPGVSNNCFISKPGLNYNEKIYGKYFVNGLSELRRETLPVCKQKYGGYWGNCENWKTCSFATENELKNFYDSTSTKFFKYVYWSLTVGGYVNSNHLPYMGDYSQPWTDQRFYEFFKLTPEEIKTIEEYVQ